jgi:Fe-S cluster assembly iron-binding protein IscA
MLTMTEDAAQTIGRLLDNPQVPEHAGLRIAAGRSPDGDGGAQALEVMLAEEPAAQDLVLEEAGARVFIEQTVAPFLDNKLLDVALDGERAQFSLIETP